MVVLESSAPATAHLPGALRPRGRNPLDAAGPRTLPGLPPGRLRIDRKITPKARVTQPFVREMGSTRSFAKTSAATSSCDSSSMISRSCGSIDGTRRAAAPLPVSHQRNPDPSARRATSISASSQGWVAAIICSSIGTASRGRLRFTASSPNAFRGNDFSQSPSRLAPCRHLHCRCSPGSTFSNRKVTVSSCSRQSAFGSCSIVLPAPRIQRIMLQFGNLTPQCPSGLMADRHRPATISMSGDDGVAPVCERRPYVVNQGQCPQLRPRRERSDVQRSGRGMPEEPGS